MSKKKILIVDDDPDFVMSVKSILEKADYDVDEAYNGKEGLESVESRLPDLIILDVMMPVMNGHVACKELQDRGHPDHPAHGRGRPGEDEHLHAQGHAREPGGRLHPQARHAAEASRDGEGVPLKRLGP
jgi:DNA-binding LytR/AlgR family response regulator